MTNSFDRELFASFLEEVGGYLPEIERALECYFADSSRTDCLEQAHRLTHTITGASAMLNLTELSDAARRIEGKLEEVATGAISSEALLSDNLINDFTFIAEQLVALVAEHAVGNAKDEAEIAPPDFDLPAQRYDESGDQEHDALPSPELMMPQPFGMPCFEDGAHTDEFVASQFDEALHHHAVGFDTSPPAAQFTSSEFPQFEQQYNEEARFDATEQLAAQTPSAFPPKADAVEAIDPEMLEVFQEEAEEHLRTMSAGLAALVTEPDDRAVLQEVRRSTHTLKGAAGVVGLTTAARVAHRMEDLLDELYENNKHVGRDALNLLLRSTDVIEHLARGAAPGSFQILLAELNAGYDSLLAADAPETLHADDSRFVLAETSQSDIADGLYQTDAATPREIELTERALPDDTLAVLLSNNSYADATLGASLPPPHVAGTTETTVTANDATTQTFISDGADGQRTGERRANSRRVVRVPLERLDSVIKLVGELIISRAALENHIADLLRENEDLLHSTERLRRVSTKLETEYEASFLRSGAERVVQFAGAQAFGDADSFSPAGHPRSQFNSLAGASRMSDEKWTRGALDFSHDVSATSEQAHGFDELEFDRYTEFHRLSRELAEASTDATAVHSELKILHGNFEGILLRQRRLTNDVQERLMRVRMIPLQTLAARLERTVRVAADAEGKGARLLIDGAGVELDTTVLDEMADPLLHILRNAVSHGIERAEVRRALGKPEQGTIRLRAAYEGSQAVIEVTDDGGGIDAAAVGERAVEAGFVGEEQAARMTERERLALVFLPGLSTARRVSEISGRGVGMDVVRDTVERLQGTLDLESTPGAGMRLTIRLPLTLASTRALLVRAGGGVYAIPTSAVRQVVHADEKMLGEVRGEGVLRFEGASYRVAHLADWLRLAKGRLAEDAKQAPVLILRAGGDTAAVIADEIVGWREIVVKPLGADLRRMHGVMGATVMGDGRVIPILNPEDIVRGEGGDTSTVLVSAARPESDSASFALSRPPARRVLVVDDSPSVRRVMTNLLKQTEWTPVPAKDGLDALEILHNSRADELPSVILLDVEMPRMDGYELLATLRQQETMRHIPVVMITSRTGEKHRQKALGLGASEYLTKPYQDDVLLAHIARLGAQSSS
ncbi:MAG: response regulator [Acidobacteriota bacterium]|nr:response regulator [Acidobacteriota bacterium]